MKLHLRHNTDCEKKKSSITIKAAQRGGDGHGGEPDWWWGPTAKVPKSPRPRTGLQSATSQSSRSPLASPWHSKLEMRGGPTTLDMGLACCRFRCRLFFWISGFNLPTKPLFFYFFCLVCGLRFIATVKGAGLVSLELGLDASMAANESARLLFADKKIYVEEKDIAASEQNAFCKVAESQAYYKSISSKKKISKIILKIRKIGKMCVASGSHCLMVVSWNVRHKLKSYCVARPAVRPATPFSLPLLPGWSPFLPLPPNCPDKQFLCSNCSTNIFDSSFLVKARKFPIYYFVGFGYGFFFQKLEISEFFFGVLV